MKRTLQSLSSSQLIWLGVIIAGMIMIIVALFLQANEQEKQKYQSVSVLLDERIQSNYIEHQNVEDADGSDENNLTSDNQQIGKVDNITEEQIAEQVAVNNEPVTSIPEDANNATEQVPDSSSAQTATQAPAHDGKININTATAEQLQTLKGIGPSKAAAIIADRNKLGAFQSINEIKRVKGIGEKLYAGIKESIVAEP